MKNETLCCFGSEEKDFAQRESVRRRAAWCDLVGARGPVALAFGGREEDKDLELFGDVVEAVAFLGCYKYQAAAGDLAVFEAGFETGAATNHVVDLVLAMRLLVVGLPGGQDVETGTHRRHAQELAIGPAAHSTLLDDLG